MNNSLTRLIDGMVETLRKEVIPRVEGDFARGQAFGVIYMLNSLKLRSSWSNAFLLEQLKALEDASLELRSIAPELQGAPFPDVQAPVGLLDTAGLEAMRDDGDSRLCDLVDWLAANDARLPASTVARAQRIIDAYLARQAKYEIATSAKPMFVEMSSGAEKP